MHKYRFVELLCIILAILFIVTTNKADSPVTVSASLIYEEISADGDFADLILRDNADLRNKFGFDIDDADSFVYYSSDDVMNVNELLIIVSSDTDNSEILSCLEQYVEEKYTLFNGYAPEQAALLQAAVIEAHSNLVFFCIDEDAHDLYSAASLLAKGG